MQPESPPKEAQKYLGPDPEAVPVATDEAGDNVKRLAAEFGIHRVTISAILRWHGVL